MDVYAELDFLKRWVATRERQHRQRAAQYGWGHKHFAMHREVANTLREVQGELVRITSDMGEEVPLG